METVEISNTLVWAVSGGVFLLYMIFSIILDYHWKKYGKRSQVISLARKLYFVISGMLLSISVICALLFTIY
ncbi:MAG: hypothetical protein ACQESA_00890 [Patescibacteria group bacterium]